MSQAADEAGGRAFATDYAGDHASFTIAPFDDAQMASLRRARSVGDLVSLDFCLITDADVLRIVGGALALPPTAVGSRSRPKPATSSPTTRSCALMELPPYRRPDARTVARLVYHRSRLFVREAGTIILACTVVLWALLYFPRSSDEVVRLSAAGAATEEVQGAQLRGSYAGRLGQLIEPAIEPLGFDWKVGVGLIGAFAAREVFISTMGVVYGLGEDVDEETSTLREKIHAARRPDGRPVFTPLMGLSLMVFFALACQCMSTLAVLRRETRSYRWPAFAFVYMSALAWISALLVYQGGRLLGFG